MKNLFVLPVLALTLTIGTVTAQDLAMSDASEITLQDKYVELAVENLPQPVLDAVANDYEGATISKAAAKEDASEFKLELSQEDGETMNVYIDAEGNWIAE
ncbi:hypothetical protein ACE939_14735 [Aquimarina sp. W85]|uniref:hypothetical protein n=1 Tax=Aquimarina rhodophyticola TaxID=3342246 RepID=UPI003672070A